MGMALAVAAYPEQRPGVAVGVYVVDLVRGTAKCGQSATLPNSEIVWFPDGKSVLFSASYVAERRPRVWLGN